MARSLRFGGALLLVLVVGCSVAPATLPAQPVTAAQVAPPTPEPAPTELAATTNPTAAPAPLESAPPEAATPNPTPGAAEPSVPASPGGTPTTPAQAPAAVPAVASDAQSPDSAPAAPSQPAGPLVCDDTARPDPLPAPGSGRSQDFFRSFRTPLAPAPLYDPPGPRHVGLQAGHWLTDEVPPELGRLQGGAVGGGKQEWEVNLDIARRAAALLEASGIQVDLLPATIPAGYRANAFLAMHADGDPAGVANGFKVARPGFSSLPDVDDRLVETLNQVYAADTELPRDDEHISLRMRYYYAFNSRRYCHAVAPGVPQAIIEMGYLTSAIDRRLLIGDPDRLARGVADGIQAFLSTLP
ncbi:MAG TPA: N-acetylmuramoyl-L-alanine amidase [Chloroflexota bacterium]|nr:N-acetylmuramoyl-L-alanine amidase [Chloroflexota bacterium]